MKRKNVSVVSSIVALLLASSTHSEENRPSDLSDRYEISTLEGVAAEGIVFTTSQSDEAIAEVSQIDKKFVPGEISIKAGGKIAFVNDDDVSHNVYCQGKDFKFNVGSQNPGERQVVEFTQTGRFMVRCAIHLDMKLFVTVE